MAKKVIKGENDLATTHPELAEEWHLTLNGDLLPSDVLPGSNKRAYWKCSKCGYVWDAKINNRAVNRRGCPCCANRVVVKGINDLATTHPEIAKEWYQPLNGDVTPFDITHGSGKKFSWKCPRGHIYQATVLHRTSGQGTNCPVCNSGRQTSFAEQALFFYVKKIYPNAVNRYTEIFDKGMELDIYIPEIRLGIEYDGVYWHRKREKTREREKRKHEICASNGIKLMRVREGKSDGNEFPAADESVYLPAGEKDLTALTKAITHVLAKIDPETNMWTRSDPGRYFSSVDVNIERDRFEILSYLSGPVKNSIKDAAPELVDEWDHERNGNLEPEMISAGSSIHVYWICKTCGHSWSATPFHRIKSHTGCPKCAGFVVEKGVNDLQTLYPELIAEWDHEKNAAEGILPDEIRPGSGVKCHWKCSVCQHEWIAPVDARTVNGSGCIKCGYKKGQAKKQERFMAENGSVADSFLINEWDFEKNSEIGLSPEDLHTVNSKSAFWICSVCGHRWKAPINKRFRGMGCRKCADKANPELLRKASIKKGNVISDQRLIEEWDYDKNEKLPSDYSSGSGIKVYWRCKKCGHEWKAEIKSRVKGANCPACAGNVCVPGENDLKTKRPDIAAEWDYEKNGSVSPSEIAYTTSKKYWWKCGAGHDSYLASPSHRVSGTGCPICGNLRSSQKQSRAVEQLTLNGEFVKRYNSLGDAAEACGVSKSAICNAAKGGRRSAGYMWKYADEE